MNILLKAAKIIDTTSPYHQQQKDILIQNFSITKIEDAIDVEKDTDVIQLENLHISSGWFDTSVSFGEPGFEERETLKNGLEVAAKSGFTQIALNSNTNPISNHKAAIEFLKNASKDSATQIFPIGAATINSKGEELAELYDMQVAGAIAFGDYNSAIANENLMKIALQYTQNFNGLLIAFPIHKNLANNGVANEGVNSTILGLKGSPALAEHLQIARDLMLLEYTGGKLHIPTISTENSVKLIQEAKKKGLQVTCSVAVHHLFLSDDELTDFDSNKKVNPPLRTNKDVKALQNALKKGLIDCITTDHQPIDIENKKLEFSMALDGTIGLESAFGVLNSIFKLDEFLPYLTTRPRAIFNLQKTSINIGEKANITLFNPTPEYIYTEKNIRSTSKNAAFLGKKLKGEVYGVINNQNIKINGI